MRSRLTTFAAALIVTAALATPAQATVPGDNGNIAFVSHRDGNDEIYVMNADGSGQTRLTSDPRADLEPSWSPDGARIAFASFRDGNYEIYVMNADGSGVARLTNDPASDRSPSWSPDGGRIAFTSDRGGRGGVHVMNADGSGVTRLTNGPERGRDADPKWSPDGGRIAFARSTTTVAPDGTQPTTYEIYVMRADGSDQASIFRRVNGELELGDWSPDSASLLFASFQTINAINADGSDHVPLTSCYPGNLPCGADFALLTSPVWSPDQTKIAFGHRDCYLLRGFPCTAPYIQTTDADGSGVVFVADYADDPSWQPLVNGPPDCSGVAPSRRVLWPPNGRFAPIAISGATDPDGDPVTLAITGVTQDEPTGRTPDAKLLPMADLVKLRARRSNRGDGRVYRIGFTATDGRGGVCTGVASVGVPRNKNRPVVDSAPPSYDSLSAGN